MRSYKNVILGAGLSGLSCAYHMQDDYVVFEKLHEVGGLARSEEIDGFIFDYAPHILYTINPYVSNLIHTLLKGNLHIKNREAYIYHGKYDLYTRFPFQAHLHGLPESVISDCLTGLGEALKKKNNKPKPQNYKEWMYYRFGKGITEHLMIPYAERIWTVSPTTMNYEWIDRRVPEPDFERIVEGAKTDVTKREGFNNDFWYPIEGGIEALPVALAKKVKNINLNMQATKILPSERIVEFNHEAQVRYARLISTLPLPVIVKLIEGVPKHVEKAAGDLQNNSIVCVNLGVDRPNVSPYHWLYFYEEDFIFHRMSFPMNLSSKTTPAGKSSITCEIAHSRFRPLSVHRKEDIINKTVEDLIKAKILNKDDKIVASGILAINHAYVIYDLNHRKNVATIHNYLRSIDIYPCGRFGEWEYFNMDHSIWSGKQAAEKINNPDLVVRASK